MNPSTIIQKIELKIKLAHLGKRFRTTGKVNIKKPRFISLGDDVVLGKEAFLYAHPADKTQKGPIIIVGNNTIISEYAAVSARQSIIIEDRVGISSRVIIQDHSHGYEDVDCYILDQPVGNIKPIRIGEGSWIGINAAILPGADIGKHCVIGINSVVKTQIPDYCVAVGAPARIVKHYDFKKGQWEKGAPEGYST